MRPVSAETCVRRAHTITTIVTDLYLKEETNAREEENGTARPGKSGRGRVLGTECQLVMAFSSKAYRG
jgi:hypothetical protein